MFAISSAFSLGQCAANSELVAGTFGPYPGYTGGLSVAGTVSMYSIGTTQIFTFDLSGLDTACTNPNFATAPGNSCGLHIHAGKTCDDASSVGGHYWVSTTAPVDPWSDGETGYVAFYSTTDGTASGSFAAKTGATTSDIEDRAFIVHGESGGRIACALMKVPPPPEDDDDSGNDDDDSGSD
jgi:Cu/Zn superoxide dismutase